MNTEMGPDEVLLGIVSLAMFTIATAIWGCTIRVATRCRAKGWPLMVVTPLIGLMLVFVVLAQWADDEVRNDVRYIILLLLLGGAWMGFFSWLTHWLGISLRQDAAERRNVAAAFAWCGAMLGITVLYAGGNTGEGPSLWNNVFSAALGTAAMVALWLVLEFTSGIAHSVTVERDAASGLRLGGFMLASGLVFGRALAGDWRSMSHTASDFLEQGWIVVPMLAVAVVVEFVMRPTRNNPQPSRLMCGVLPAAIYLAAAGGWLKWLGKWK